MLHWWKLLYGYCKIASANTHCRSTGGEATAVSCMSVNFDHLLVSPTGDTCRGLEGSRERVEQFGEDGVNRVVTEWEEDRTSL